MQLFLEQSACMALFYCTRHEHCTYDMVLRTVFNIMVQVQLQEFLLA